MSLRSHTVGPVPEETARIARAAFPRGNLYIRMRIASRSPHRTVGCQPVGSYTTRTYLSTLWFVVNPR
jgi:hypothetical protein